MAEDQGKGAVKVPVIGSVQRRWLVVGAATVGVIVAYAYLIRPRLAGSSGVGVDPATGSLGVDAGYVNPVPDGPDGGSVYAPSTLPRNNTEWGAAAVSRLTELNYDASVAGAAIGKYLTNQPLTDLEETLVRTAIGVVGWPPEGPPPILKTQQAPTPGGTSPPPVVTPPPAPGPKPAPPRRFATVKPYTRARTNKPWDTLSSIASAAGRTVSQLASWNNISNPDLIHPGQTIWVDPPGTYVGKKPIN